MSVENAPETGPASTPSRPSPASLRFHPDIFTSDEAAAYLRLESDRSLQLLRRRGWLKPLHLGRGDLYHREDLDAVVKQARQQHEQFRQALAEEPVGTSDTGAVKRRRRLGRETRLTLHG